MKPKDYNIFEDITQNAERISKKYKKNKVKQKAFLEYSYDLKRKGKTFEQTWKNAVSLARKVYGFNNKTNKSLSEIASTYVKDASTYVNSFLDIFESQEGTSKQKFEKTQIAIYEKRTEAFLEKYRNEKLVSDGSKTLGEYFEDFKNGEISMEEMNEIIRDFKKSNLYFLSENEKEDYRGRNNESNTSIE